MEKRQESDEVKILYYLCIVERKETFPSEKSLIKNQEIAPGNEILKNFFVSLQQKRKTTTFYKQF